MATAVFFILFALATSSFINGAPSNDDQVRDESIEFVFDLVLEQSANTMHSYVVAGIVVVIPSSTSKEMRRMVLNHLLFASLAAQRKYDRIANFGQWMNLFDKVVGLAALRYQSSSRSLSTNEGQFTLSDLALREVTRQDSGEEVLALKRAFDAIKQLPADSKVAKLLSHFGYDAGTREATTIVCSVTGEGMLNVVAIHLSGVSGVSGVTTSMPLFHRYEAKDVRMITKHVGRYKFTRQLERTSATVADKIKHSVQLITELF